MKNGTLSFKINDDENIKIAYQDKALKEKELVAAVALFNEECKLIFSK